MKTMTLKITNPQGQTQTFFDVVKDEYINGINHIELADGTKFTVNCWNGWKIVQVNFD